MMMQGEAFRRLADTILAHSLRIEPGHKVLIDVVGQADDLVELLIDGIHARGAYPLVKSFTIRQWKRLIVRSSEPQLTLWTEHELIRMKQIDAYIGLRADENLYELEDVDAAAYARFVKLHQQRIQWEMANLERWVLLRYPTGGMAQMAKLSHDRLTELFLQSSCGVDYARLAADAAPLGEWLDRTEQVRILGPRTDLRFSIRGIGHFVCDGRYNLPDGEIFTAPVADSAEGHIAFNVPSIYLGKVFEQVSLEFRQGRVVRVSGQPAAELEAIIQTDEGAGRIGEFGIGLNPYIRQPMRNLAFDEKMAGSLHLALGQAYPMADNGNASAIHWDLVLCQLEAYGGGALYFDDVLIRENGLFTLPELAALNEPPAGKDRANG